MAENITYTGIFTNIGGKGCVWLTDGGANAPESLAVANGAFGGALEGDLVQVSAAGQVLGIVARGVGCVAGTLVMDNGDFYIKGTNGAMLKVQGYLPGGCRVGDKVCAHPTEGGFEVKESFGAATEADANMKALLCGEGLSKPFTADALFQAKETAFTEITALMALRTDLRGKTIITLSQNENSRTECGFSVERDKAGNYVLGLHTVDVAEFIASGSALEQAVFTRGKTAILPDKEIPMLPDALSKGPCFLEVGEDRLAVSYFLTINEEGTVLSFDFCESIIKTAANCLFDEIEALLLDFDASAIIPLRKAYASIMPTVSEMFNLGGVLQNARVLSGGADIDRAERRFVYGRHGVKPIGVISQKESDPERLIREFLAIAGRELALYLNSNNIPAIYRVQAAPTADALELFRNQAEKLGVDTFDIDNDTLLAYAAEYSHGMRSEELLLNSLHATMPPAGFSTTPMRHPIHGTDMYVRFAYPINRCADFCIQRVVKALISAREGRTALRREELAKTVRQGVASATVCEKRASRAETRAEDIVAYDCLRKAGVKEYTGLVSDISATEITVLLDNGCVGCISLENIGNIQYKNGVLTIGDAVYSFGSEVRARFAAVDFDANKLYLEL